MEEFIFYCVPYVPGYRGIHFGRTECKRFVPGDDARAIQDGIEAILDEMQLGVEKANGNSVVGFEMTVERDKEREGQLGAELHAWGTGARLEPLPW